MNTSGPRSALTGRALASLFALTLAAFFMACGSDRITGLRPSEGPAYSVGGTGGVVISQIYGAGGNTGAVLANDYVELYNPGSTDVAVDTWSVQYASASGTGNFVAAPLKGKILAGHYYLVQLAGGATGGALPAADAAATAPNLSGTTGKVALVNQTAALACNGNATTTPCTSEQRSHIIDLVGFGTANFFEGSVAPAPSATTAIFRKEGGLQDTDNNGADFEVGAPNPRNSSSTGQVATLTASISPSTPSVATGATQAFTAAASKGAQIVSITSAAWTSSDPAVATIDPASGAAVAVGAGTTTIGVTVTTAVGTATASTVLTVSAPVGPSPLVISQVYGGGGNSGATLKNDYVELYNAGTTPVSLKGWSLQYSNATTAGWSLTTKTDLSGTIEPGHYFLIQEAAGAGGSADLPAPDFIAGAATGTNAIGIGSNNGKIALVNGTTLLTGNCPKETPSVVDFVGYGTADCFKGKAAAPALVNTTAAVRKDYGRTSTGDNAADFEADTAAPHNSASVPPTVGPATHILMSPATWSLFVNQTKAFIAKALDDNNYRVYGATFTWTTDDAAIATVDATGVATARKVGSTTVRATTPGVAVAGTATIEVTPVAGTIVVQARANPLPVGYQTQLFLSSGVDADGKPVGNEDVVWSSATPGVVSVNPATGVLTARGIGQAIITATAKSDGISKGSTTIVTSNPSVDATARTGHNTELGVPADADPSDDIIIARRQYTTSYNPRRGVANWVSWNLDASHKGSVLRCNCFTADSALGRLGQPAYETSDWINDGSNGQYSRGHMSPSADWQISEGDNAPTFFLTNMLPQNQAMNGGPWGEFENYLRTRAVGSAEVYIVSGGIFTKNRRGAGTEGFGTISNRGKVAIPDSIWKVAVIVPDGRPGSEITRPTDVEVIAINTPNEAPANGATYATYYTTVDRIQKSTGYDLLSILPEAIQCRLEARNCVPTARIAGSGLAGGVEGQTLSFSAAASDDADGDALSYRWDIDGEVVGTGVTLSHLFGNDGAFQLRLIVADAGSADTVTTIVNVADVPPTVHELDGATIAEGGAYTTSGSFTDPGMDQWMATVDYGDGSGVQPLVLVGMTFALAHTYADDGSYQVKVVVRDGAGATGASAATVTVNNVAPAVAEFAGAAIQEGGSYAASGSFTDPGDDSWTATVDYGDGTGIQPLALVGKSFSLSHTYAASGQHRVTVTVTETDAGAASGSRAASVTVANVPPTVAPFTGATILRGESYVSAGTFADPGADSWTASVNYGDESSTSTLALDGHAFSLRHSYPRSGIYAVTVTVTDSDQESGASTTQVTVLSAGQGIAALASTIAGLASTGAVQDGDARWLANKLDVAAKELARGNAGPTRNQLDEVLGRIEAARAAGRLSTDTATALTTYTNRLLGSM